MFGWVLHKVLFLMSSLKWKGGDQAEKEKEDLNEQDQEEEYLDHKENQDIITSTFLFVINDVAGMETMRRGRSPDFWKFLSLRSVLDVEVADRAAGPRGDCLTLTWRPPGGPAENLMLVNRGVPPCDFGLSWQLNPVAFGLRGERTPPSPFCPALLQGVGWACSWLGSVRPPEMGVAPFVVEPLRRRSPANEEAVALASVVPLGSMWYGDPPP
ncbi:hypothetical protein NDU88_007795 [Pleurodeles waltl]|uniref:Uncharacterized protein n=1 Tax=Pleurodeles waltl TaxID=8319 RepID=A0AAV7PUY0_PLEWA|nr:hypothetical protein NDU88_007795 [Pleurodeles waltl]